MNKAPNRTGAALRMGERTESSRYELLAKIASGGMGAVYVARSRGALGFENLVAVKRPHAHLLEGTSFRALLVEEARIASRIRHANVVAVRDVAVEGALVYLVMDYIEGASVAQLAETATDDLAGVLPIPIAIRLCLDAAAGLHAAHEALDENGRLLGVVHRDISPQNVLVGVDGIARLTDFGIAKCLADAKEETTQGLVKGKLSYVAPEYVRGEPIDRRSDVFGLAVVLWELLAGRRLFRGSNDAETLGKLLLFEPPPPSRFRPGIPPAVDEIVLRALAKLAKDRPATAEAFGEELEQAARAASLVALHREVAACLRERLGTALARRASAVRAAMVEEGTVDLEDVPAPAKGGASPTESRDDLISTIVATGSAVRPTRDAPSVEQSRLVVTPPQEGPAPPSVVRGTGPTILADVFLPPTQITPTKLAAAPAPLPFEKTLPSQPENVAVREREEAVPSTTPQHTLHLPAPVITAHATVPLGAPRMAAPAADPIPVQPLAHAPSRPSRSLAWLAGVIAVLAVAIGGYAFARSRGFRSSAQAQPTAQDTASAPVALAPPPPSVTPSAAPPPAVAPPPPSAIASASASSTEPPPKPAVPVRSPRGTGRSVTTASTASPTTTPAPSGSTKLKAAPNPYAD